MIHDTSLTGPVRHRVRSYRLVVIRRPSRRIYLPKGVHRAPTNSPSTQAQTMTPINFITMSPPLMPWRMPYRTKTLMPGAPQRWPPTRFPLVALGARSVSCSYALLDIDFYPCPLAGLDYVPQVSSSQFLVVPRIFLLASSFSLSLFCWSVSAIFLIASSFTCSQGPQYPPIDAGQKG